MTVDVLPEAEPVPGEAGHEVWALVLAVQAGDTEAFGLIYDRYVDTVFRFIYFRVGNKPLAEDLVQDTFLRAFKRINGFTWMGRDFGAWLITIARNLVADHFKSGRYRLEVTTGDVLDADREDRGPEGSPESAVVDHITNVALLTALRELSHEQQQCLILRFFRGMSVQETADAMDRNEGAVKALQYRATRALARVLSADPAFDSPEVAWIPRQTADGRLDVSDTTVRAWARAHHHLCPSTVGVSDQLRARYIKAMGAGR